MLAPCHARTLELWFTFNNPVPNLVPSRRENLLRQTTQYKQPLLHLIEGLKEGVDFNQKPDPDADTPAVTPAVTDMLPCSPPCSC